jgi:nucleotide-binding universal stress UspA family protein
MPNSPQEPEHFIVVGIDGSDESKDALRWGARQAELTGAELRVVISWHVSSMAYGAGMVMPADVDFEGTSQEVLDHTIKEVLGEDRPIKVRSSVVQGYPAPVLLDMAAGADLLVVGSRGHGAFAGMILGSVSEHCVAHAACPVVVVRRPQSA